MGVLKLFRTARPERTAGVSPPSSDRHAPDPRTAQGVDLLERRFGAAVAPAAVRIRHAVLLHRTGRKADAWAAFGELLADPALGGSPRVRPMLESEIYARMRVCLEREGCFNAALTPAVQSYAARARFFAVQERRTELKVLLSPGFFDRHFTPLLERARALPALAALRELVLAHLGELPPAETGALAAAVDAWRVGPVERRVRDPVPGARPA